MNKKTLFNIHFYLSSFFTPFLVVMAITGTSYLFGYKGNNESTLLQENITLTAKLDKTAKKSRVIEILSKFDQGYRFEYLKDRGSSIQTRPTTRQYYNFKKTGEDTFSLYKVSPNFLSRIIEVHKGHGPTLLKYLQKILGVSLFLIVLTGLLMSLKMKNRIKSSLITMGLGLIILLGLFTL